MAPQPGVKLLISGLERSGKTTLTSNLKNAFILHFDAKIYPYKVPHTNLFSQDYKGITGFRKVFQDKMQAYKAKNGNFPKTIVFDTITQLYSQMTEYAADNFKGYERFNNINEETLGYNRYIEENLVGNGINVVIVAHTQLDKDTGKFIIPATGSFKNAGSWLSVVDNASYVEVLDGQFSITHKDFNYPCRSTLGDDVLPAKQDVATYDINKHIELLAKVKLDNKDYNY
jgi:hypothetical protein